MCCSLAPLAVIAVVVRPQLDDDIPGVASSQMFRFYHCNAAAECNEENWPSKVFAAVQFVHNVASHGGIFLAIYPDKTSLKWLTVAMPLLETSKRQE